MGYIVTRQERQVAAGHWLSAACSDLSLPRAEWAERGVALLPCGILFSAVRLPVALVHAAAAAAGVRDAQTFLNDTLAGPVFLAPQCQNYYALIGARSGRHWSAPGTECLGPGTQLGVPSTDRIELTEDLVAYWVVPMDGPGTLCNARDVYQLVHLGRTVPIDEEPGNG